MGWFKEFFFGKPCGSGGEDPFVNTKLGTSERLYHTLNEHLRKQPNHVACLESEYTYPHSTTTFEYKFWVRLLDGKLVYMRSDSGFGDNPLKELTVKNILKVITDDVGRSYNHDEAKLQIGWTVEWVDLNDVPSRSKDLIANALASAQPYTALPVFQGYYAVANHPDQEYAVFSGFYKADYAVPYWVTDLSLHIEKIRLPENPNAYRIIDHLKVDPKLLPDTHWRKWVRVEPAADNANAVMKYVPRDIARGKVQYFDVFFDFNEARLAGVSFATGKLLEQAIDTKISQLDRGIETGPGHYDEYSGHYRESRKSDTYLKPEQIKVLWESRTYLIEDYLELERQSTTNLERPYLAPNQEEVKIDGNKFSIDADYYINFTPWEPKK